MMSIKVDGTVDTPVCVGVRTRSHWLKVVEAASGVALGNWGPCVKARTIWHRDCGKPPVPKQAPEYQY